MKTYHYRIPDGRDPICGAIIDEHRHHAVYYGYFLGLAQSYGPGEDLDFAEKEVQLCEDCLNHDDVVLALLGEL